MFECYSWSMQPAPHPAEFADRRDAPRVDIARRYSMRLDPCDGRGLIVCALLDFSVTGVRLELPDNTKAAAVALAVNSTGTTTVTTVPLLTPEEIDAAAQQTVHYTPPGG